MFSRITISDDWQILVVALISATIGVVILAVSPMIPRFYGHFEITKSIQAVHSRPTPRVGGVAIFSAVIFSTAFAPPTYSGGYAGFISATTLLFVAGLLEDLGFGVSPSKRLFAAMASSLIVIALLGIWLPRVGIPSVDKLMSYAPFGIPFTLLITAGVTNGFNLIDGVNGLAGLTALGTAVAFSTIAQASGNHELVDLNLMLTAATFGFFILNFPFGLIFLGDAGAYTLGFVLAWFGIALLVDIPEASPWAVLLCLFWPIADMLLAIFRRLRRRTATTAPDRLHVHQLVMRSLEMCVLGRRNRKVANPLTTVVLAPFVLMPPVVGALFWNDNWTSFLATVLFAVLFVLSYNIAPRAIRRWRTRPTSVSNIGESTDLTGA